MKSRAYRVRLSTKGVEAYLACNYRLGKLTHSFVPYGTTLFVALLLADELETFALAKMVDHPTARNLRGTVYYNVGMAPISHSYVYKLIDKLRICEIYRLRPPLPTEIYVGSILTMMGAEDLAIQEAYERMHVVKQNQPATR
jgi:hypothetical protein